MELRALSFTEPFHFIQHDVYLIVSDRGDHPTKYSNRRGNFLYKFGKEGNADREFDETACLTMIKAESVQDVHLIVCDNENHRIQVFDLSGIFVAKFRKKRRGMGE